MRAALSTMISMMLLSACGTSPPVQYFRLDTIHTDYQRDAMAATVVAMGPIRIPEYLKRPQMVVQQQGAEVKVDEFNRWAEPLDQAVHRTLASNADTLLDSVVVLAYPTSAIASVKYRVVGRVDRFDSDQAGTTVLAIQWGIADEEGNDMLPVRRSMYKTQATPAGDAAAIAQAMSKLIAQCSEEMATEIEKLVQ